MAATGRPLRGSRGETTRPIRGPRTRPGRGATSTRRPGRTLATLLVACAAAFLGAASAQIGLTTFTAGDVIRADEVNANFRSVADAAEANQARLDAIETGTVRVGPHDLVATESEITASTASGTPYAFERGLRGKSGLELLGSSAGSDGYFCFGTGLDLPDGASIVEFAAILRDPDVSGATDGADAFIEVRAWTGTRTDDLATVAALGTDYAETATTGGDLPAAVDTAANEYRLMTCLQGEGGFLGARVESTLP